MKKTKTSPADPKTPAPLAGDTPAPLPPAEVLSIFDQMAQTVNCNLAAHQKIFEARAAIVAALNK